MITFGHETDRRVIAYLGDLEIGKIEKIDVSKKSKIYKCEHNEGLTYESPTLGVAYRWFEQFGDLKDVKLHEVENQGEEKQEGEGVLLKKITKLEADNRELSKRNLDLQEVILKHLVQLDFNLQKLIKDISNAIKKP